MAERFPPSRGRFNYGDYYYHGLRVGITLLVFAFIGWWLDSTFHWSPVATIAGVFIGAVGGFYSLYLHLFGGPPSPSDSE